MDRKMNRAVAGLAALALAVKILPSTAHAQRSAAGGTPASPAASTRKASPTLGDRTKGFSVGVYTLIAPGVTISGDEIIGSYGTSLGPGAGALVGYGFNKTFSAYASLDLAKQSTAGGMRPNGSFGLVHFEVGGRANLPIKHPKLLPYASAAIGNRGLGARVYDEAQDEEFNWTMSGAFFALGGGAQYFLSPKTSLDGGITLGLGSFSRWDYDGDIDTWHVNRTNSVRVRAGMTWRP
jgi:hypothetical protein